MDEEKIENNKNSYDEVPYISKSFHHTFPGVQKAVLQLLGFSTPNLKNARILEIGCSFGGNIIPFAIAYPESEIIGIDLSELQIKEGNNIINFLELTNIKLLHKNILDFDGSYGKFDYIICHGVYSWVEEKVQNKILDIIRNQLVSNGTAVISYNTYPGWKNIDILRDIMNFRINAINDRGGNIKVEDKVSYGKGAIKFIEKFSSLNSHMKNMISNIENKNTYYILHEYFENINNPLYLYDFNKKLSDFGLFHIIDSKLSKSIIVFEDSEINEAINKECGQNHVEREQWYDYLLNRQFRTSIITHIENKEKINLSNSIKINDFNKLHIRGSFLKNSEGQYVISDNIVIPNNFNNLIDKLNNSFPNTLSIEEIMEDINDKEPFYQYLMNLVYSEIVEFFTDKIEVKNKEKLCINNRYRKYMEYMLKTDGAVISFANFIGAVLDIQKYELQIMLLFDGTRTNEDIEKIILKNIEDEILIISESDPNKISEHIKLVVKNINIFLQTNLMDI